MLLAITAAALFTLPSLSARALPNCPQHDPDCGQQPPDPPDGPNDAPYGAQVALKDRTAQSFTVNWIVPQYTTSYTLQRSAAGGAWVDVLSATAPGPVTRSDTGLTPDTRYCYRLLAKNSHGTGSSPSACAFTKDGRGLTAFRVQIRLETGDVSDGGTDDDIAVSVSGGGVGSVGGMTWLDHARDDFERGDVHNYDLVRLDGIEELGDIQSITISKFGDDAWCLKGFTLLVDGRPVFNSSLGAPCQWIGDSAPSGITATREMLRGDSHWSTFGLPIPDLTKNPDGTTTALMTITRDELEQRVESMVGHAIHGTDAYWGHLYGRGVEVTKYNDNRADVDLDLAADVFLSDPEVDVNFQFVAGTHKEANGEWKLDLSIENVVADVDLAWWEDILDVVIPCGPIASVIADEGIPFCLQHLADGAASEIAAGIPRATMQLGVGALPINLTASFDADANLNIVALLPAAAAPPRLNTALLQAAQTATVLVPSTPPPPKLNSTILKGAASKLQLQ
jgi:hypothetical protein